MTWCRLDVLMNDCHRHRVICSRPMYWHPPSTIVTGLQAPELLLSPTHYDGKGADVWAAGVLLYTLLCGACRCLCMPFREITERLPQLLQTTHNSQCQWLCL